VVDRVRQGLVLVGADRGGSRAGSGSGFMLDRDGRILTSRDLVAGARSLSVRAEGANGDIATELVGTDRATDLALLKISRGDAANLEPLKAGDDSSVRVGEPVVTVGAPFWLDGASSAGIVSALEHPVQAAGGRLVDGALETDAAVERGNAGGPLVDGTAHVVGVNLHGTAGGRHGYAIPIGTAQQVAAAIEQRGGDLSSPALGLGTATLTPGLAETLGLTVEHGLLVRTVAPGSPAARAGLRPARADGGPGDVITTVAGKDVRTPHDIAVVLAGYKKGRVVLGIERRGKVLSLRLSP
jgi:S1-C subfamily serine protease